MGVVEDGVLSDKHSHDDFNGVSQQDLSDQDIRQKLKGYYLVRSYAADADPYAVISDLPEEEGQAIVVKNDPVRGADNYDRRIKTEDWLRKNVQASDIKMDKATPAYFAFTNDPDFIAKITEENSPHKQLITLPADEVDLSNWSFTMDDHFFSDFEADDMTPSHAKPHPLHGRVLNAYELVQALEVYGYPEDPYENNFEAQMWANEPRFVAAPEEAPEQKQEFASRDDGKMSFGSGSSS